MTPKTKVGCNDWMTKSERVSKALERLSRNRWLPPKKLHEIAIALAACKQSHSHVLRTATKAITEIGLGASAVGILRGAPAIPQYKKYWLEAKHEIREFEGKKRKSRMIPEFFLLNLIVTLEKKYGPRNLHVRRCATGNN